MQLLLRSPACSAPAVEGQGARCWSSLMWNRCCLVAQLRARRTKETKVDTYKRKLQERAQARK